MNNLYRELAPVTDAAWASIEEEARRTFERPGEGFVVPFYVHGNRDLSRRGHMPRSQACGA